MPQSELYPLNIQWDYPYQQNTAVLNRKVRASDGLTYAVKTADPDGSVPASEWICAEIAHAVGVPTPFFRILRDFDGLLAFGSRWETGLMANNGMIPFDQVEDMGVFSSIFVFDLLVANVDRHGGNMLYQTVDGKLKVLAFDHSHTLLHHSPMPLPGDILLTSRRQQKFILQIMQMLGKPVDATRANAVLDIFGQLSDKFFAATLSPCYHWLDGEILDKLTTWLTQRRQVVGPIRTMLEETNHDPIQILSRFPVA